MDIFVINDVMNTLKDQPEGTTLVVNNWHAAWVKTPTGWSNLGSGIQHMSDKVVAFYLEHTMTFGDRSSWCLM